MRCARSSSEVKTTARPSRSNSLASAAERLRMAPRGAILKRSAADAKLFEREGRAVVFTSLEDLAQRIDDPTLDVTPDDFLVLQHAGPTNAAAIPEAAYLPIP